MTVFNHLDYWKAITLFGLNVATYKPALAKVLISAANEGVKEIKWEDLSRRFLNEYKSRIESNGMPQQSNPGRKTKLERIIDEQKVNLIDEGQAIWKVANEGFNDVVPRFHTVGQLSDFANDYFYEIDFGRRLILKDSMLDISKNHFDELNEEIEARWSLLEGAFKINHSNENLSLANNIRETYLKGGYTRKNLTNNIPFLMGYQGNVCFYCGEVMTDIHVDHVLPRQIIQRDDIWNLVLAHDHCNQMKSDLLVGPNYIDKLIKRNENIMGSNHPWKSKIQTDLGNTSKKRRSNLRKHYERVKIARGASYWGGSKNYNPETDPFYRRLITKLNGG